MWFDRAMRSLRFLAPVAALVLVTACSDDVAQTGENVIETEIQDQLGLGELDASCDQPGDREVGTEFTCTATTEDGQVIEFLGAFTGEKTIFVQPTNVVAAEALILWKAEAARVLSPELPIDLDPDLMDCPDDAVVFLDTSGTPGEASVDCTYPDPDTGASVPMRITVSGFVIEQGYQDLFAAIGNAVE